MLKKIDHVTCVVRPDTIKQWAWFYIDVLGGVLTLRVDDTNPSEDSSMMVWTIDFEDFGVALIAGIDRDAKSHVSAFEERHGDHSFQHVAFQVQDLDAFREKASARGVSLLGDTLVRKDASGRHVKQVFGSPFHDHENSALVGFYEFVERPRARDIDEPGITFSAKAGSVLYQQAQRDMVEDRRTRITQFSKMPPDWEPPEATCDQNADGLDPRAARPGRRTHDAEPMGEIHRWANYRGANRRFPDARAAEIGEMFRLVNAAAGENIAEVGTGHGALTAPLATAVGPTGRVFTYDISRDNLVSVMLSNDAGLPIIPVPQSPPERASKFPNGGKVDCVATLATFHHFDSHAIPGTQGRSHAMDCFYRMLRSGGRLVIGDVGKNTAPHHYFDAIDDPRYCSPHGHPHEFLSGAELGQLCEDAGFCQVEYGVRPMPWVFECRDDAVEFLATMHNAQCPLDEVLSIAKEHLRFDEVPGRCVIEWELLFVVARKP